MPVSRSDVLAAYHLILGRQPESDSAVECHLGASSLHALRKIFMESEEFRQELAGSNKAKVDDHALLVPLNVSRNEIEVRIAPKDLPLLLERVEKTWKHLGCTEPYWSVLTDPGYRPDSIDGNMRRFYQSGLEDIEILRATLLRCVPAFEMQNSEVTEYGCGVGRVTVHLAKMCARVTACDISEPHLLYGIEYLKQQEIKNVLFEKVTALNLMPAGNCDLWFSRITLQHNPPPIIGAIIKQAFLKLNRGGVAVFQVPTYRVGYRFSTEQYLQSEPDLAMEMHAIPQSEIFRIADTIGIELLEVREDNSVGDPHLFVSNTFCFRRP